MDYFRDAAITERVLQGTAAQAKLNVIRKGLKGKVIKDVDFTNEGSSVGVLLIFNDGHQELVMMKELALYLLLRDECIAREEWALYHSRYAYPIPTRRKRKKEQQSKEVEKEKTR